ncbi:MAG: hypothetical protein ABIO45_11030 [Burkholderiaceae bacterium]
MPAPVKHHTLDPDTAARPPSCLGADVIVVDKRGRINAQPALQIDVA